jgi:Na+/citrate or Na+/malate symporter
MADGNNNKNRANVKPVTSTELAVYAVMVVVTAATQFVLHTGKSLVETLAWVIIYSFFLGVVFFGWARQTTRPSRESEK